MTFGTAPQLTAHELPLPGEIGFLHSEQTGSALDGPGLRTVFFLSGCVMRCQYCHNPDTWKLHAGRRVRALELVEEALKYEAFTRRAGGGVTLSGGEPLVQHAFAVKVLEGVHGRGLHTALDTNGYLGARLTRDELSLIDLVLLDLKAWDPHLHRQMTRVARDPVLAFAERLASEGRPAWVRFVLVPGLTDAPENILLLARFCAALGNVQRVDVLPFHQLGRSKWQRLGLDYALERTSPAGPQAVQDVRAVFREAGLNCPG
jgi:pyruvate formate lyase activating enzyme